MSESEPKSPFLAWSHVAFAVLFRFPRGIMRSHLSSLALLSHGERKVQKDPEMPHSHPTSDIPGFKSLPCRESDGAHAHPSTTCLHPHTSLEWPQNPLQLPSPHLSSPLGGREQRGRVRLGNLEQHPHGVELVVRRLDLRHLDQRDAQGPDVSLVVIGGVLHGLTEHHLRGHPEPTKEQ